MDNQNLLVLLYFIIYNYLLNPLLILLYHYYIYYIYIYKNIYFVLLYKIIIITFNGPPFVTTDVTALIIISVYVSLIFNSHNNAFNIFL